MKLKALVAAAALAASGASMAETFNLGSMGPPGFTWFGNSFSQAQTFSDTFNFTLNGAANSLGAVWDVDFLARRDVELTSISLIGGGLSSALVDYSPIDFSFSNLLAGSYSLIITGTVEGRRGGLYDSGYVGQLVTTRTTVSAPVPEPETIAMMALGLGVMGFVARRRKQLGK